MFEQAQCPAGEQAERSNRAVDLHLIFPPQWSPFQPFLSTPSLKAYLQNKGHRVLQSDWNVGFYGYFISESRAGWARKRLARYIDELDERHSVYRARAVHAMSVLREHRRHRANAMRLREPRLIANIREFKLCVDSFQALLDAFSVAEPVVEMGTSSLSTGDVMRDFDRLSAFLDNEGDNPFLPYFRTRIEAVTAPRYFGISIIGQEQIVPGLTLGRLLKHRFPEVPVIVGGSVFSRLVEKDANVTRLFGDCLDFVCRYEGEQPMDAFLSSADPRAERTPNIAFVQEGELVMTPPVEPLGMSDLPTPDFADLALEEYLTPNVVLPLLTTRGCYWGKCAFCYHGMIYQDRYRMRDPKMIAQDVNTLNARHGVRHFAFNDEALPPKMFRLLPDAVEHGRYFFTALYKFEKYFRPDDYRNMYSAGFRSLYIGLESASERVQRQMQKRNLQSTMISNLQDAHDAGLWSHTFNFFGFPTETEAEAQETIDFLVAHADIIHSEGTGTFSFEHNAPIHHDPERFGIGEVIDKAERILELYYDYRPTSGLDAQQAEAALEKFTELKTKAGLYQTGRWIPREFLLILLSHYERDVLKASLREVENVEVPDRVRDAIDWISTAGAESRPQRHFVVNKKRRQVFETNEDAVALLDILEPDVSTAELCRVFPLYREMV
jgi:hypothetical protein